MGGRGGGKKNSSKITIYRKREDPRFKKKKKKKKDPRFTFKLCKHCGNPSPDLLDKRLTGDSLSLDKTPRSSYLNCRLTLNFKQTHRLFYPIGPSYLLSSAFRIT